MSAEKSKQIVSALLAVAFAAFVLAACGGGGGSPQQARTLLRETFKGAHQVNSGKLTLRLAVAGSGSKTLRGPVSLTFGGPFQSQGNGQLPKSDFTINLSFLGRTATLGVISTGTNGYVTLQGTNYQLPSSTFRQLESSFASATGSGSRSGVLGKLGINPLGWVRNPTVVGSETVGGADTTHIHGSVAVSRLLSDLSTVLQKASSLGVSGSSTLASGIPASTRDRIAREVRNPTLDVWTGSRDHTLRKLEVNFDLPVSGAASTLLGGLRSAHVSLLVQYADINQPQTIATPTSAQPFSQFVAKVRSFVQGLQGNVGGSVPLGGGASSGQTVQRYTQCIQKAGGDVAKMQRCASILNGQ
jgi:hypothetical protein